MSTTLSVILMIVLVLAVGLLRDSIRTGAVNGWARRHGFVPVLRPEHDHQRLVAWAERFRPNSAAHWGIVLRGETSGLETFIGEHEDQKMDTASRWHTLAVTRVPGLQVPAVRIVRSPSPGAQSVGQGKWAVDAANGDALAFWSNAAQAAAIDAWTHHAELATVDDYVLVRVPGVIAAGRLDDLLASAEAARSLFKHAAGRLPHSLIETLRASPRTIA